MTPADPPTQKTILITGGSRGIGAATARLAAERGWHVGFSYFKDEASAADVLADIKRHDRRALAVQADVGDAASIKQLWKQAIAEFGRIDGLVNNAAILERQCDLVDMDPDRLNRVFRVNVMGTMLCAQEAVRHMSTSHGGAGGAIVNLSSVASILGAPGEYVDYASSKGAVDSFTVGLAKEVALEGIRVNAVRPGTIHTEIHASGGEPDRVARISPRIPMRRGGEPVEIAEAILWLLSSRASYATGTVLAVAGGL